MTTSDAVLDRLLRLHPKRIDLSLDRIRRLLAALGNPERALPPVVHVAGTNGKGSLVAFLRAMLEAAGYRVHVYTSPHLVRFNERIRVAGRLIEETALGEVLSECEAANATAPITFFEITTAAAMLAFARSPADVVLLETGLGGRLDATNVLDAPRLTAITPISRDHRDFLGDRIDGIAAEKAAVMRAGVPCVVAAQSPPAASTLAEVAAAIDAPLFVGGRDWRAEATADGLAYRSAALETRLPPPALPGPHQIANAGQAVACLEHLAGFLVPQAAIAEGLREVVWPGRLQHLAAGALARHAEGSELWLDGGHNSAAAAALAAHAVAAWRERPLHLVVGMLESKPPEPFLAPFASLAAGLAAVAIPGQASSLPAARVAQAAHASGIEAVESGSVEEALRAVPAASRVLVCGSLTLAGYVLAANRTPPT